MKKATSLFLALALVLSCCPVFASAQGDGLCQHHEAHDENCGYFAGAACSHVCGDGCLVTACTHDHLAQGCTEIEATAGADCDHDCADGTCSYRAQVPGADCDCGAQPQHGEQCASLDGESPCDCQPTVPHGPECAYAEFQEEIPCDHSHGDCAYAEPVPGGWDCGHTCTMDGGCITRSCSHTHDASCGWQEARPCAYLTNGCEVCKNAPPSGEGDSMEDLTDGETCICEISCGGDNGINPDCALCLEDFWLCTYFVPSCTCAEKCTAETVNYWCPICGAEDAALEDCTGDDVGVTLESYKIWVGGVEVTSENLSGTGWKYDHSTSTLTLTYATIKVNDSANTAELYSGIFATVPLTIHLVGSNTVSGRCGIDVSDNLKITGESLTVRAGDREGILAGGDLTISNAVLDVENQAKFYETVSVFDSLTFHANTHAKFVKKQGSNQSVLHCVNLNGEGFSRTWKDGNFYGLSKPGGYYSYFEYVGKNHCTAQETADGSQHTMTCDCTLALNVTQPHVSVAEATCYAPSACLMCGHETRAAHNMDGFQCRNEGCNYEQFPLWVQNIQVDTENASDVLGTLDEGETVTYDPETSTLTLNGANITSDSEAIKFGVNLNLNLVGNNIVKKQITSTIEGGEDEDEATENCNLTISGTGSLSVTTGVTRIRAKNVTVSSGNITINGGNYGILAHDTVTINDGTVTVTGAGRCINGMHVAINGGIVTVNTTNVGVFSESNGGTVTLGAAAHVKASGENAIQSPTVTGDGYSKTTGSFTTTVENPGDADSFEFVGREHAKLTTTDNHTTHTLSCACCAEGSSLGTIAGALQYTADGATITKSCTVCGTVGTLTLEPPVYLTYDGTAKHPLVKVQNFDAVTGDFQYTGSPLTDGKPVNPGTYTASYTYQDVTASVTYTIEKKMPVAEAFTITHPTGLIYDGAEKEMLWRPNLPGDAAGMGLITDRYYDSRGNLLEGSPVHAGTYTLELHISEGSTYKAAVLTSEDWTFTIDRKQLAVTALTVPDKVYDGKTDASVAEVTFSGLVAGESLAVGTDFTVTAAFADAAAGADKPVNYTVTLRSTEAAANYTIGTCQPAAASITPAPLSILVDSFQVWKGEPMPEKLTYRVEGLIGNDELTQKPTLEIDGTTHSSGVYPITAAGAENSNYNITYFPGELTVVEDDRIFLGTLTSVPEGVSGTFDSVKELKTAMENRILVKSGYSRKQMQHYDVHLQFKVGRKWINATEENYPLGGITVTLPYPSGTGSDTHDFTVVHMFTVDSARLGTRAGEMERPAVTETDDGLRVTLNGLSPVTVAWKSVVSEDDSSADYGTSSGTPDTTNPRTGDPIAYAMSVMLISAAALYLLRKKRVAR